VRRLFPGDGYPEHYRGARGGPADPFLETAMSTQPDLPFSGARPDAPRIAQPGSTPEELRAALALLCPDALPTFDAERAAPQPCGSPGNR
jgi:hypothetical protein